VIIDGFCQRLGMSRDHDLTGCPAMLSNLEANLTTALAIRRMPIINRNKRLRLKRTYSPARLCLRKKTDSSNRLH